MKSKDTKDQKVHPSKIRLAGNLNSFHKCLVLHRRLVNMLLRGEIPVKTANAINTQLRTIRGILEITKVLRRLDEIEKQLAEAKGGEI